MVHGASSNLLQRQLGICSSSRVCLSNRPRTLVRPPLLSPPSISDAAVVCFVQMGHWVPPPPPPWCTVRSAQCRSACAHVREQKASLHRARTSFGLNGGSAFYQWQNFSTLFNGSGCRIDNFDLTYSEPVNFICIIQIFWIFSIWILSSVCWLNIQFLLQWICRWSCWVIVLKLFIIIFFLFWLHLVGRFFLALLHFLWLLLGYQLTSQSSPKLHTYKTLNTKHLKAKSPNLQNRAQKCSISEQALFWRLCGEAVKFSVSKVL